MPVIYEEVEDCPFLNSYLYIPDAGGFYQFVEHILKEFPDHGAFSRELCGSILKELLIELYRYQTAAPSAVQNTV